MPKIGNIEENDKFLERHNLSKKKEENLIRAT